MFTESGGEPRRAPAVPSQVQRRSREQARHTLESPEAQICSHLVWKGGWLESIGVGKSQLGQRWRVAGEIIRDLDAQAAASNKLHQCVFTAASTYEQS